MRMIDKGKLRVAMLAGVAVALSASPALAATPSTVPSLAPLVTALNDALGEGIAYLISAAPILIAFALVWGLIRKSRQMAK